jgi:hypothetical protein
MGNEQPASAGVELARGTQVVVRSSFDGSWCSGFEIAHVLVAGRQVEGYRLRRHSDGSVLQAVFPPEVLSPVGL